MIAVDAVPSEVGVTWEHLPTTSTRTPSPAPAVHLRIHPGPVRGADHHVNLATNVVQVIEALRARRATAVSPGCPSSHDMGLIIALLSPMIGHYCTFS